MIETERLLLRAWRDADTAAHRALVLEPSVIATLAGPPPLDASAGIAARQNALLESYGSCFWAVEHRASGEWIGWCGIKPGANGTPIADRPEIGWSLQPARWGQGFAREAASAALAWAWANTAHDGIWSITSPLNTRSWGLMERLGMTRVADGAFEHPALAEGHPLRRHITYMIERPC